MAPADPLEQFFDTLAAAAGTEPISRDEAEEVLELAKVVAQSSERRFAPITTYLAGLAIGASGEGLDTMARSAQVRAILQTVERLTGDSGY